MTLNFFERFQEKVRTDPDHVALQVVSREGRETFTSQRIWTEISRIGLYLHNHGIGPGKTVGILMENHPRWGVAFLATQSAGARIVPFDIVHSSDTLARLIDHAGCQFLIVSSSLLEKLAEIQERLGREVPVLISGEAPDEERDSWDQVLERGGESPKIPLAELDLDETFLLVYTSGTTGDPKGVMLSPRNVYQTVIAVMESVEIGPADHILSVLPLYHMLALMTNFLMPLYMGSRVTYLDSLEPQRIMQAFRDEGITIFVCVPQFFYLVHRRVLHEVEKQGGFKQFLFKRLLRCSHFCINRLGWNPGKLFFSAVHKNFGALRFFAVGGARFDPDVATTLNDLGFQLAQAYGMSETAAITTVALPGAEGLGTAGKALPHARIRIENPDEEGIGEVLMSGSHIMQGYWRNPAATKEVLDDGWMHSGDLGYLDDEGFLHITGRMKDVIVLPSGKNIFPEEVEAHYEKHCPFVQEMCVVGIHDSGGEEGQEKLHAVVVPDFDKLKADGVVNANDMIRYLFDNISQQLPSDKKIRSFELRRDPLPRTTTRKIKRFEIQEEVTERAGSAPDEPHFKEASTPENPVEEQLFQMLRESGKVDTVNRAMNLELDCGFDSLGRVEFLSDVQDAFQITISDEEATQIFTVEDLERVIQERLGEDGPQRGVQQRVSWSEILSAPLSDQDSERVHRLLRPRMFIERLYFFLSRWFLIAFKLLFRIRYSGLENLPEKGAFMICPNHESYIDGFMLASGLPFRYLRRLFFLGYADYFSSPILGFLGALIKIVPVDADRHLRQALRLGAEGLRRDLILCVFPEGERTLDGSLRVFRKGPAILAKELEVPVVPVAIRGAFEVWARGAGRIQLHPIQLHFGKPLEPPPSSEDYDQFNDRLKKAVGELIREVDAK